MSGTKELCADFSAPISLISDLESSPQRAASFSSSPASGSFPTSLSAASFDSTRRSSIGSSFDSDVDLDTSNSRIEAGSTILWPDAGMLSQHPSKQWAFYDARIVDGSMTTQLASEQELWSMNDWQFSTPETLYSMTPVQQHIDDCYQVNHHQVSSLSVAENNPALSRQVFFSTTRASSQRSSAVQMFDYADVWMVPQTVAPQQTFHPLPTISSTPKAEPSSPLNFDMSNQSGRLISSSPQPCSSPCVPSSSERMNTYCNALPKPNNMTNLVSVRRIRPRENRRQYRRPVPSSIPLTPPRLASMKSKSGGEAVIRQNGFACHWPGCVDKDTGKPRRFKRQEHKKRHVDTVHIKEKSFKCWVTKCEKSFPRLDNLKAHIKNTHGKNNPSQRNRYVATLDRKSKYYDPEWRGALTEDGYPLMTQVDSYRCWVPNCIKVFHVEDKLKVHLLQQHGRKMSNPDIAYVATLDEASDFFDPDWQGSITEDGLPAHS